MRIVVNGEERVTSAVTLAELCRELDLAQTPVATARNGEFVPSAERDATALQDRDVIEILSPRQGG